jgi:predicted branched-subunit amino acid permease
MKDLKTNKQAVFAGIRNAFGIPALLLFSAMTGFGSLAQEQGLSLYISMLSTVLIWGMPGQVVHVELYGLGAPLIAVALGVAGANARFMPMTLSMMPVFADSPHNRKWNYFLAHLISINTWAEMLHRGREIRADRRMAYFLGFSITCMTAGIIGVFQGYMLFESLPEIVSLCLIFLVPIYFGLIMSNTMHPPYLIAFVLGCLLGPPMHLLTPEWGLVLSGIVAGSLAFLLCNRLKNPRTTRRDNG